MKIVNITNVKLFPPDTGGAQLVFSFLKFLSKKHKICLITVESNSNKSKKELEKKGIKIEDVLSKNSFIKFCSPITIFKLVKIIRKEKPQKIIIDFPWFGVYGYVFKKIWKIPYILHEHNIEYLRFKRIGKWWWRILKKYELFVYKHADKILCISDTDKKIIINEFKTDSKKIIDCPYGVDTTIFRPDPFKRQIIRKKFSLQKEPFILFFGSLDYPPNIEAIKIITNEIIPRVKKKMHNVKFVISGKNPPKDIHNDNIIFTGFVSNIVQYIQACDIVIVPLLTGGGVRTKIIESLACGKTVISTQIGSEGVPNIFNENLFISNNWNEFSNMIITKIKNPKKDLVPTTFENIYDLNQIIKKIQIH